MLIKSDITIMTLHIIPFNEVTLHTYDNRRTFIRQQNYFTYQRKGNQKLQIQALNNIVADLQNQINNFTFAGSDPDEPSIDIM